MGLESPGSRCVQRARQILVYGRPLETDEIVKKIDRIDAAAISAAAQRLFGSTPTIAALGQIDRLGDYGSIASQLT
jgi:predicted Zn-dependent peptidase